MFAPTYTQAGVHLRPTLIFMVSMLALASCGGSPNAPGTGGVTRSQAEDLNQAAAELDARANAAQPVMPAR
jgi:hypothetical protein